MSLLDEKSARRLGLRPEQLRYALIWATAILILILGAVVARRPVLRFDLLTPIVVYLALEHDLMDGLGLAVAVGYVADVHSGEARGLTTAVAVLVFLVLRLVVLRIIGAKWLVVTAMTLVASGLALALRFGIEAGIGPGESSLAAAGVALPAVFGGALFLGYPVYRILAAVGGLFNARDEYTFGGSRARP